MKTATEPKQEELKEVRMAIHGIQLPEEVQEALKRVDNELRFLYQNGYELYGIDKNRFVMKLIFRKKK